MLATRTLAALLFAAALASAGCGHCRKSCGSSGSSYSPPCACAPIGGPPPAPPPAYVPVAP